MLEFTQLYALANPSALLTEPAIIAPCLGVACVATEVSIPDRLLVLLEDKIFNDDLTDYSWSDGGRAYLPKEPDQGPAQPRILTPRKEYKKAKNKKKRSEKRSQMQKLIGTDLKLHALKKYSANPKAVGIPTGFDATNASVTGPGWVGQSLSNLPSRVYTIEELTQGFKLKLIPWDGRYAILPLLLL